MVQVFVADNSYVVRKGFIHLLSQFSQVDETIEVSTIDSLSKNLKNSINCLLLISTNFASQEEMDEIIKSVPDLHIAYVVNTSLPPDSPLDVLSTNDSKSALMKKLELHIQKIIPNNNNNDESEELSNREKLILKNVALGLTNKEIANELFISTHTVISHRKNITRKLGIKTVSGLTVYAILNNLISMNEIS